MLDSYKAQLASRVFDRDQAERQLAWLGNARFLLVLVLLALLFLTVIDKLGSALLLSAPAAGFLMLSIASEFYSRRRQRVGHAIEFIERIVARMENRWAGTGFGGAGYLPPGHPCAADLDLFGDGSLYERICLCATQSGRDKLAEWLLQPAGLDEIRERQQAIRELSLRSAWRERNYLLGSRVAKGINTTALAAWGRVSGRSQGNLRIIAPCLIGLTLLGLVGWGLGWWPPMVIGALLLLQGGFAVAQMSCVQQATAGLERRSSDLFQLVELLTAIETETFQPPALGAPLANGITLARPLASAGIAKARPLDRLAGPKTQCLFRHCFAVRALDDAVDLGHRSLAAARPGAALQRWVRVVGEIEAITSIASYAAENPTDVFPDAIDGAALFDAKGLAHPLLPGGKCVANDLTLDSDLRLLVVSGSNMSGKSTLLRSAGISAVLAQMGAPVRAVSLRMSRLAIGATLHIQDSLQQGRSRFYAEISRLRQIVELAKGHLPVFFLLDEILHGTNSSDRKIGAEAVVRSLLERPTIGMVTTHDLALSQLADDLAPRAANVHFEDDLRDGEMHFDYRLKEGPIRRGNALALMRAIGLDVEPSN